MEGAVPTRAAAMLFALKAMVHRTVRSWQDAINGDVRRWPQSSRSQNDQVWGEAISPLYLAEHEDQRQLVLGKVENLRVAVRAFNGIEVPANGTFSFWAQLGRPIARRGFVPGRELREGCIIPTIGGGLCQMSNALYQAALEAGLEIVERRGHSQVIDGSAAQAGRDATVFWNYVDLRFRSARGMRIEAVMDGEQLRVRILKAEARAVQRKPLMIVKAATR
ncbi:MAG: VanW family protein, partial [Massilia sp.]